MSWALSSWRGRRPRSRRCAAAVRRNVPYRAGVTVREPRMLGHSHDMNKNLCVGSLHRVAAR